MAIDSKNLLVWVKAMSRGQALPLDASEIYESMAEAQTYASTSAIAYAGQTIKVKMDDGKYHTYTLQPSENSFALEESASGGSGATIQADWAENDPNADGYVANRTHWAEPVYDPIVWEGDTEGRDTIDASAMNMGVFYKVSDIIPSLDELKTVNMTTYSSGLLKFGGILLENETVGSCISYSGVKENVGYVYAMLMVANIAIDLTDVYGFVIPSAGLYVFIPDENVTKGCIIYFPEKIHKLPEKYLPDTIITESDLEPNFLDATWASVDISVDGPKLIIDASLGSEEIVEFFDGKEVAVPLHIAGSPMTVYRGYFQKTDDDHYSCAWTRSYHENVTGESTSIVVFVEAEITSGVVTAWAKTLPDSSSQGASEIPDDEMLEFLMDMDLVQPLSDNNNLLYVDENNKLYVL